MGDSCTKRLMLLLPVYTHEHSTVRNLCNYDCDHTSNSTLVERVSTALIQSWKFAFFTNAPLVQYVRKILQLELSNQVQDY